MKIEIIKSGGIAGITEVRSFDSEQLKKLAESAIGTEPTHVPGADFFTYTIKLDGKESQSFQALSEVDLPDSVRDLLMCFEWHTAKD